MFFEPVQEFARCGSQVRIMRIVHSSGMLLLKWVRVALQSLLWTWPMPGV